MTNVPKLASLYFKISTVKNLNNVFSIQKKQDRPMQLVSFKY